MRAIPLLLAALLLPLAAGCGSARQAGNAASAVPADVAVYVSVDTSFEGGQWRTVRDLVGKFPDGDGALDELLDEAAQEAGLADGQGLKDALGPEVGIAVLELSQKPGAEPPAVVLTQPRDVDAFRSLLEDGEAAFAEVNGWEVVAPDEATLDRYRDALDGPTLEGSEAFDEAMDDLDPDALVHAYVNGEAIVGSLAGESGFPAGALPMLSGDELGTIGMTLRAEDDGVRLEGRVVGAEQAAASEPYRSELVEEVPGDVLAFVSFNGLGQVFEEAAGGAGLGPLPFDLGSFTQLFDGETAVYVRPGTPQPSITLVTEVDDEAAALKTARELVGLAGAKEGAIFLDAFDGLLVASTAKRELAALRADGPKLEADDAFEHAAGQAGLPDETTGFGYVDLPAVLPIVLGLAPGAHTIPGVSEYLEPLGGLVFWGGKAGDVQDFSLFVGID